MKIIAFDTSTEYCSIALLLDSELLSREVLAEQRHSELILPMLQRALEETGMTLAQMDGIAFGAGPGSFTGLRIACGVAQGLAFGADLPVMGICTLEALAQEAGSGNVIAALDARMGEIYHAAYTKGDGWQSVSEPALCLPQHAPLLPGRDWIGCGSGFSVYEEVLRTRYNGCVSHIVRGLRPHARAIAQLAAPRFEKGSGLDPAAAAPFYIRNKVALKEKER
ncbi:tRNA (adenosine(37)-N6)-threonylcarbamoyltransferase complex dimerization subunit type 1 TsaB [Nitrosospira sp. Nl5]|uniref:tRNA (adenosine(37)-N6)-threonylcarbamoyltransferase complex dimerization subunit type 1 TsaB n=1 Tax=Nitrosospira sp. Nl5 TaxID=200120 RepID=UPI000B84CB94|nr:tRNA (adenosine(37)-N6)-threonylcarbamoyltransferase complex dimerization subunit type 1 TsaB [Nitrosospira sp. Nl5]